MRRTAVITDAQGSTSAELSRRQKRYVITMLFRLACFIAIFFVPGVWRWVLGAAAVFLPYIAVILANQADTKGRGGTQATEPEPELADDRPELEQFVVIEQDETPAADDTTVEDDTVVENDTVEDGARREERDDAA